MEQLLALVLFVGNYLTLSRTNGLNLGRVSFLFFLGGGGGGGLPIGALLVYRDAHNGVGCGFEV